MKVNIEISEEDVIRIIRLYIEDQMGHLIEQKNLKIMVKSKQNYKSEWERADFKVVYEGDM